MRSPPLTYGHASPPGAALMPQIRSQYSRIDRSDENFPARAVLSIDIRLQRFGSLQAALTRS